LQSRDSTAIGSCSDYQGKASSRLMNFEIRNK